jgi:hypothetical protein
MGSRGCPRPSLSRGEGEKDLTNESKIPMISNIIINELNRFAVGLTARSGW